MPTNPVAEFFEEYGEKREKRAFPSMSHIGSSFGSALVQGAGGAAAAGIIAGAGVAANKLYQAATKAHDFRSMMELNPDLHEYHERDTKGFNAMFSSLRKMNPDFGSDPIIAGTYMRRMAENPLTAGGILAEGLQMADKIKSPFGDAMRSGMQSASSAFGAEFTRPTREQKMEDARITAEARRAANPEKPEKVDPLAALREEHDRKKLETGIAAMNRSPSAQQAKILQQAAALGRIRP